VADKLRKQGLVTIECALRNAEIGLRLRKAGLSLRDIGACHLADLKA
jgi:hypothetical protein